MSKDIIKELDNRVIRAEKEHYDKFEKMSPTEKIEYLLDRRINELNFIGGWGDHKKQLEILRDQFKNGDYQIMERETILRKDA